MSTNVNLLRRDISNGGHELQKKEGMDAVSLPLVVYVFILKYHTTGKDSKLHIYS
jgi:hypothetical protein